MKKLTLFTAITINYLLLIFNLFSQPRLNDSVGQACLPEGITFTTQAQIDQFQTNYPNCTEIEGDVTIGGEFTNITNLSGLSVITSIDGTLEIVWNDNLANLSGLNNLTFIGGDFVFMKNDILTNLIGLENLDSIGGNFKMGYYINGSTGIDWGTFLTSFTGLENLTSIGGNLEIINNYALTSFTGLDNVVYLGGDIIIDANLVLSSLTGLENLYSLEGGINIGGIWSQSGNPSLTSLTGLDNLSSIGWFYLENNDSLTSLDGLNNLNNIGGELWIADNDALISLSGLENLTSIDGDLSIGADSYWVDGNHSLTSLTALANLVNLEGNLSIHDNISLISLTGLENVQHLSLDGIYMHKNSLLSTCEVESICNFLASSIGYVSIQENAPGCNSPEEVIAACDSVQTSIGEFRDKNIFTISPNPLESNTIIEYTLYQNSPVSLKIHDLSGQVIVTLANEFQSCGNQKVLFTGNGLKPGIYFCLLKTKDRMQTRKMIKL